MPTHRMYTTLASWWPLLSPKEHYAEETEFYLDVFTMALGRRPGTLLELGSGCGPIAANIPSDVDVTLVDISQDMLDISQQLNPGRTHVCADMRTLALDRTYDAILLHDAVMYLTSKADLRKTLTAMHTHCAPGGAVLIIPDALVETFSEFATSGGWGDETGRAMQMMEWHWDPDPSDETIQVEFSLLLREANGAVHAEHEQHTMGLFSRDDLWDMLQAIGFVPISIQGDLSGARGEPFLAVKPR